MNCLKTLSAAVLLSASMTLAQQAPTTQPAPISREEYERLLRDQAQMRQELDQLKAQKNATPSLSSQAPPTQPVTQEDLDDIQHQVDKITRQVHSALPGSEHLLIAGDAAVGFTNQQKTNSTFSAIVSPLVLWQPSDQLLFEADRKGAAQIAWM
jgi:hypothetical protein